MDLTNQRGQLERKDHVAVEIIHSDVELVSAIIEKMETMSPSLCIYRVPENICKENEAKYIPKRVSIGPFHHGKDTVREMEKRKWHYFHSLLARKPNIETSLDTCVKAIKELEHRARKCYKESISLSSHEFVEMMIVDGCFVIELFLRFATKGLRRKGDSIFEENTTLVSLRRDMILLENQIPFFVLQHLFDIVPIPKQCDQSLNELAFRFFRIMIPGDREVLLNKFSQQGNHLLDLIHNCYLPSIPRIPSKTNRTQRTTRCAEKVQDSGVKFKKVRASSLLNIKFVNGVLKIPPIIIQDGTNSLFRNLIALEQCNDDSTKHITSYAFFMGGLIGSPKDLQLLSHKGIIRSFLHTDEEAKKVSSLFKDLCKEISVKDFYYAGLCAQVNGYKQTHWLTKLKCGYFKTPLFSNLAIALLLVILTVILFFCTIVLL